MKKTAIAALFFFILAAMTAWPGASAAARPSVKKSAAGESPMWFARDYADNFVESYFPSARSIDKMDIWGFFYLWALVSFIDSNIPEGLDGARYATLVRDLRMEIDFLKRDMLHLLKEVWGVRKIDRDVMNAQLFSILEKLRAILANVQRVRTNLIKPAYFLFNNSLDHTLYLNNNFDFSAGLDYLSVDSLWAAWRPREELFREALVAKSAGVSTVKVGVYLDYWVYRDTGKINDIRETLHALRAEGFKLYINFLGVRGWYEEDFSFRPRSGKPNGAVNFITWRYHCEQAVAEIVREFKPEFAGVIREPLIDFQEQVNETVPVALWLSCFSDIAGEVASISPQTTVVLENTLSSNDDFELFKRFQELKPRNVAFGALIYSLKDIFTYNQYSKACKVKKRTIVADFWDSVAIYIDEYAEDFIYLVYRWALNRKISFINLSRAVNLHTYDFEYTPAYYRFKNVITSAYMEGICRKGVKASGDGIYGSLYERFRHHPLECGFAANSFMRELPR